MNEELLNKLLEYIDARIAEKSDHARDSSDGGLIESMRRMDIEKELRTMTTNCNESGMAGLGAAPCSAVSGHFDNRETGYRESWQNGKVQTRIHSSQITAGYPCWRTAWGTLPDLPNHPD